MIDSFETKRLIARPLISADADALHEIYADAEAMRYWSSAPHVDHAQTRAFVAARLEPGSWSAWTLVTKDDGTVVGLVSANERRPGVIEIGYLIVPRYWRRGFAREAASALIDRLFAAGNRRIFADIDPDNTASNHVVERLGFMCEGRLRGEWQTHIGVRDSLIWGLLREDWPNRAEVPQPAPPHGSSAQ